MIRAGLLVLAGLVAVQRTSRPPTRKAYEWALTVDRPINAKYEDFAFPDSQHGWLVTAKGEILNTSDRGLSWRVQASGFDLLRSVEFLDTHTGFAGTLTGRLYITRDGGDTWRDITSSLPRRGTGFCGMSHFGRTVHVVGKYTGESADYFYSRDGGATWAATDLKPIASALVDVMFTDENIGFIGGMSNSSASGQPGSALILKTTDGGKHWRQLYKHAGGRGFAWKLFPVSRTVIFAALQSQDGVYRVAKSMDSGEHWETLIVATGRPMGPGVQGIGFVSDRVGWVGGFFEGMYFTNDGGLSWRHVSTVGRLINRYQRVGGDLLTGSTRGILRLSVRE